MKRLLIIAAILIIAATAIAASIVSDPDSEALRYRMRLSADGGATWGVWAEAPPVAQAMKGAGDVDAQCRHAWCRGIAAVCSLVSN